MPRDRRRVEKTPAFRQVVAALYVVLRDSVPAAAPTRGKRFDEKTGLTRPPTGERNQRAADLTARLVNSNPDVAYVGGLTRPLTARIVYDLARSAANTVVVKR
jgi:hypothetical protein